MVEDFITENWKTKKEILQEMKNNDIIINERTFRLKVEMLNNLFMKHHIDYFIVHSSKGYKKTKSREEIIDSLEENHKRAMNLLRKERKVKRALLENGNLSFGW